MVRKTVSGCFEFVSFLDERQMIDDGLISDEEMWVNRRRGWFFCEEKGYWNLLGASCIKESII